MVNGFGKRRLESREVKGRVCVEMEGVFFVFFVVGRWRNVGIKGSFWG